MSLLTQYVWYIVAAIVISLLALLGVQTVRLKLANAEVVSAQATLQVKDAQLQAQLAAVRQLAQQGEEWSAKVRSAQKEAADARRKRTSESNSWSSEQVPIDCVKSSVWATDKAKQLSAQW
jgi:hypothetical protein